jgi:asparagine synthase (glutamine-hydrolysing)
MCGIAGIIKTNNSKITIHTADQIDKITATLHHRGPDDQGSLVLEEGRVILMHNRLSVIDLSTNAAQPMQTADGRYTLVYNGEIYNHKQLRKELEAQGCIFKSKSDTEVLLNMYVQYGAKMLPMLDGMFAIAIWDAGTKQLFLARDRFGEKPLYIHQTENEFYFASEIKVFWALGIAKTPFLPMYALYMAHGFTNIPNEPQATFYEHILKLPHAHSATLHAIDLQITLQCYWDIDRAQKITVSETDALAAFSEKLRYAVNSRLQSDVPIGTSLSGGLDSSTIVAMIKKYNSVPFKSFSAVYDGFVKNEAENIATICQYLNVASHQIKPTAETLITDFDKLIAVQEQPFASSSAYAQYKVFELAKQQNTTVLLDGQGADETLAGYKKYLHWYLQELYVHNKKLYKEAKQQLLTKHNDINWSWRNKLAAYLPIYTANRLERKAVNIVRWQSYLSKDFLQKHFNDLLIKKPTVKQLNDVLYYNTMQHGLQELLCYADKNSMAQSVEVRLPFLQHDLVEFVYSLPAEYKIAQGYTKYILRKTATTLLPAALVWNTDKIGFETPEKDWLQHEFFTQKVINAVNKLKDYGIVHKQTNAAKLSTKASWRIMIAAEYL